MSEWKCYKLNEISSLSNGINFDKSAYTSGVKLVGVSDFQNRIYPDYDSLLEVDTKVVKSGDYLEKGDIVFVRSNGNKALVGRCVAVYPGDVPTTFSGFCIRYRKHDDGITIPYLLRVLKADSIRKVPLPQNGSHTRLFSRTCARSMMPAASVSLIGARFEFLRYPRL